MYMSSLLLLSVYVHVIYILSGHICIMCTLSEVVLDIFLPNRQYQCHPYIISSTLYIFYHGEYVIRTPSGWCVIRTPSRWHVIHTPSGWCVICTPSGWCIIHTLLDDASSAPLWDDMSSTPLPDDMSSAPLPDDMSSALQRNMSYLFEVWEASNRSTRQLVWFIWLFGWLA